jgi:hypothetical protein
MIALLNIIDEVNISARTSVIFAMFLTHMSRNIERCCVRNTLNNLCYNLYEGEGGSVCLWRGQCVAMHTDLTGRQTF